MPVVSVLIGAVGFIQGFFFLAVVILLAKPLGEVALRNSRLRPDQVGVSSFVSYVLAVLFLVIAFFALGSYCVDLMAHQDSALRRHLVTVWGKLWFIGLLASMGIPLLEAFIRRTRRPSGNN